MQRMSACWTTWSGILNWSNFCALCDGRWYLSPDKKSIQIQFVGTDYDFTFHARSIRISLFFLVFLLLILAFVGLRACTYADTEEACVSVRQTCLGMHAVTATPYTCVAHMAEGYDCRFKVSSSISLLEMQLTKPQNAPINVSTNWFSAPCDGRSIN